MTRCLRWLGEMLVATRIANAQDPLQAKGADETTLLRALMASIPSNEGFGGTLR